MAQMGSWKISESMGKAGSIFLCFLVRSGFLRLSGLLYRIDDDVPQTSLALSSFSDLMVFFESQVNHAAVLKDSWDRWSKAGAIF